MVRHQLRRRMKFTGNGVQIKVDQLVDRSIPGYHDTFGCHWEYILHGGYVHRLDLLGWLSVHVSLRLYYSGLATFAGEFVILLAYGIKVYPLVFMKFSVSDTSRLHESLGSTVTGVLRNFISSALSHKLVTIYHITQRIRACSVNLILLTNYLVTSLQLCRNFATTSLQLHVDTSLKYLYPLRSSNFCKSMNRLA
jgi:hypothetical protein